MTEAEWLSADDPSPLVMYLGKLRRNRKKSDRRKFWLFACACCRRHWSLFEAEPLAVAMVVTAERYADGAVPFSAVTDCDRRLSIPNSGPSQNVLMAARAVAYTNAQIVATCAANYCASVASYGLTFPDYAPKWSRDLAESTGLLRCIFGNPFRPVSFDPAWRTSDVVALAKGIYDDRAFDRMPILADALQDAGCASEELLNHCRNDGLHARGCWVVDQVLGKE